MAACQDAHRANISILGSLADGVDYVIDVSQKGYAVCRGDAPAWRSASRAPDQRRPLMFSNLKLSPANVELRGGKRIVS